MALYYAPAIVYGGTTYYLPPFVKRKEFKFRQAVELIPIPNTDSAEFGQVNTNLGTRIDLDFSGIRSPFTHEDVLLWKMDLWNNFKGKEFTLFLFSDRGLPGCYLEMLGMSDDLKPETMLHDVSASIVSRYSFWDTSLQLSFDDYENDYPYADYVGRPSGDEVTPGGGLTPIMEAALQNIGTSFPWVISDTASSGEEKQFVVGGSNGASWKAIKLEAQADVAGSGDTTLTFSNQPIGGMGGWVETITISGSSKVASAVTIDQDLTTGDTIYCWPSEAGNHSNVEARIHVQAQ